MSLAKAAKDKGIEYFLISYTDLFGVTRAKLVPERAILVEALDLVGPNDVLVLDRGYPAAWLVALLNDRGIRFVMRCDNDSGWSATRKFMR